MKMGLHIMYIKTIEIAMDKKRFSSFEGGESRVDKT
jgi:hypothetical protein